MSGHSTYCRNGTLFFDSYVYRLEKQGSTHGNPDDVFYMVSSEMFIVKTYKFVH